MIITDISFYQYKYKDQTLKEITGWIDFDKMSKASNGVIIRAGQNLWNDIAFHTSWVGAKKAGMARGSYWFYDSRVSPKNQAQLWVTQFNGDFGELPLWADFEDRYGGPFGTWRHWHDFIAEVTRLVPGKEIGIYTGYYYWREFTVQVGIPKASLEWFKQFPLWIANYGASKPLVPEPWDDWTLWQFTDNGNGPEYGVQSGNIDLNYFNGNLEQFNERFGLSVLPPEENNDMTAKYNCTARYNVSVRPEPHTSNSPVGSIKAGETFQISAILPDGRDPLNYSKKWGEIYGGVHHGKFTALEYPGNPTPISTYEPIESPDPEVPPEEPILEFREVEFTQKFVRVDGQEVLRVKIVNPNTTTRTEVFVSDGTRDEQWSKPE